MQVAPKPPKISTNPIKCTARAPREYEKEKRVDRNGKTTEFAILLVSVDVESCAGARQAVSGLCSAGFAAYGMLSKEPIFKFEFAVEALAGLDDPEQIDTYWSQPAQSEAWKRITESRRDRLEVCAELRVFWQDLKQLGWTPLLMMRPAAFDFRVLTDLFQTNGIELLKRRLDLKEDLSQEQILAQACCAFLTTEPTPAHYDARNTMESPFGFGGASQVMDIGQQILATVKIILGIEMNFGVLLDNVVGHQLIHSGLRDAEDQANVWFTVSDHFSEVREAQNFLERCDVASFVEAQTRVLNAKAALLKLCTA